MKYIFLALILAPAILGQPQLRVRRGLLQRFHDTGRDFGMRLTGLPLDKYEKKLMGVKSVRPGSKLLDRKVNYNGDLTLGTETADDYTGANPRPVVLEEDVLPNKIPASNRASLRPGRIIDDTSINSGLVPESVKINQPNVNPPSITDDEDDLTINTKLPKTPALKVGQKGLLNPLKPPAVGQRLNEKVQDALINLKDVEAENLKKEINDLKKERESAHLKALEEMRLSKLRPQVHETEQPNQLRPKAVEERIKISPKQATEDALNDLKSAEAQKLLKEINDLKKERENLKIMKDLEKKQLDRLKQQQAEEPTNAYASSEAQAFADAIDNLKSSEAAKKAQQELLALKEERDRLSNALKDEQIKKLKAERDGLLVSKLPVPSEDSDDESTGKKLGGIVNGNWGIDGGVKGLKELLSGEVPEEVGVNIGGYGGVGGNFGIGEGKKVLRPKAKQVVAWAEHFNPVSNLEDE